jgi:DNA-directed RNA polymerase specialized sigma24 family protein
VIARAGAGGNPAAARTALDEVCRLYWYPLYAFARRRGLGPEDAEDATQAFFATLLEANLLGEADPALGRLRSFLLRAFARDLADARRHSTRLKRGGPVAPVSLDLAAAEDRYQAEPAGAEPAHQFEVAWAEVVLASALRQVESDYAASGRGDLFTALRPFLGTGVAEPPDQAGLAAALGLSAPAFRQAVSRLRDRFRTALRAQIADTLRDPDEETIDDELRSLRAVLAAKL